ncbi:hypothetical protein J2S13_001853 [Oikeobacillus pervagus]|uniref:Sporulation protein YpjB n=1 Tax=Oikeobacillus pervagus TaxID=1325931 RepID=A0AAJ1T573_9BACI|nr:hypothetical protein [Oikeobacillus pervagus]MDQ0215436.1 hypothetical protein [Oikeobacillus pervagus]
MKKFLLFFGLIMIVTFNYILFPSSAFAYSYGDPGKEKMAEAYKELDKHLENDDWNRAEQVYETYKKEFDLYFKKTQPDISEAFKDKDKELLRRSWQAAMRLNIERRLHFAQEQFEDYGQAKLLLAKARGTYSILEPIYSKNSDQSSADQIYQAFDEALKALGNPGLFGIGNKQSDRETFDQKVQFIIDKLQPQFPIVSEVEKDKSHLTEENLGLFDKMGNEGSSSFWLWFSVGLIALLIVLIVNNKRKQKKR